MKDATKKQRFIVKCELGFVNAEWINGRKQPECWSFSRYEAITYTRKRAEMLEDLCENNGHPTFLIQIL